MRSFYLIRNSNRPGVLISPEVGHVCFILEPPWRDNRSNVSCIPTGDYTVKYLPRSASGKYKDCYHVQDVEGRFAILIHKGNTRRDTMGCLLPGSRIGILGGRLAVLGSAIAMRKIHKVTERKEFLLHVR